VSRGAEEHKEKMDIEDIRAGKLKQLQEPIWTLTSQALIFVASI